jgi:catechol 2,3-dioxygenase-like lactoylglutathione lyase family enzyme
MPVLALAHYNFRAERDLLERLRAFYSDVVGLRVGPRPAFAFAGYWLYAGDRDILHLAEERPDDRRDVGSSLTFDHAAFECANWPEFEARLAAAGVSYRKSRVPGDGRLQVFFRDPAGNGVELQFPPGEA